MNPKVLAMNAARVRKAQTRDALLLEQANAIVAHSNLDNNQGRIICAVMFWCEGEKSTSSGLRFMNSDPTMMRLFITLLRKGFTIDESKFRALLQLHDYHEELRQIQFWSEITDIPPVQFHKSYIKPHTSKNTREGYPGCMSLRYGDANLAKLLKMIYSNLGKI